MKTTGKKYYYYIENDYFGFNSNKELVCNDAFELGLADDELKGTASSLRELKEKITNLLTQRGALWACYDDRRKICDTAVIFLEVSKKPIDDDFTISYDSSSSITINADGKLDFDIWVD